MSSSPWLTDADLDAYRTRGFLIVPGLLGDEEVTRFAADARADRDLHSRRSSRADGEGGAVELVVSNDLDEHGIYAPIVRSAKIVRRMELLIGDGSPTEVYHWHHKMILKEPRTGGAWAWHQDYGYWYDDGCLAPQLASCMIAVDRATRENGCLQVLAGSHLLGRITHGKVGGDDGAQQTGADLQRVEIAKQRCELVHVELEPGSAVFFHSNLLHRSDQNHSDNPRWAFICCYNARENSPYKESKHPAYSPLEVTGE